MTGECKGVLGRLHVGLVDFRLGLTLAATVLPPYDDVLQVRGRARDRVIRCEIPARREQE